MFDCELKLNLLGARLRKVPRFPLSKQFVILSVGREPDLLRTRNQVLKSTGSTVVAARTTVELVEKFYNGDFDLVLLCHTIPREEQKAIRALVHRRSPSTPVLSVIPSDKSDGADFHTVSNTPEALIAAITVLLEPKAMGSHDPRGFWPRKHA
jgi:CheY-like chemotaxis protein